MLSASCTVVSDLKLNKNINAEINLENGTVFGTDFVNKDLIEAKKLFANKNLDIVFDSKKVGTGSTITLYKSNGEVYRQMNLIIFGDVNGDGWYDGTDAVIVSCIVGGVLTCEQVGEAVWKAADCNHDGVISQFDVDLLQQAGVLLAKVDQSKSEEELQTNSSYVEYLNLLDQTVEKEPMEITEDEPIAPGYIFSFFNMILNFIKEIIAVIKSAIAFFE